MYTVVDLFAGCGGGSMGFKNAGFITLAAVEIDPDASASFSLNVGVDPLVKDIRDVSMKELRARGEARRADIAVRVPSVPELHRPAPGREGHEARPEAQLADLRVPQAR